jgi:hypothetical protein
MTLLLSEDAALRKRLQGITVTDQKAEGDDIPRQVGVFFGQPDQELRAQVYPYITIDMINFQRDTLRETRGLTKAGYLASPTNIDTETQDYLVEMPIPVNIDYQITTYSRHPLHDRAILSELMTDRLPRFGYLEVLEKKEVDGDTTTNFLTYRRMDVLNIAKRDVTEQAKRLFVNAVTVRVSSEMVQSMYRVFYKAQSVYIDAPSDLPAGMDSIGESTIS